MILVKSLDMIRTELTKNRRIKNSNSIIYFYISKEMSQRVARDYFCTYSNINTSRVVTNNLVIITKVNSIFLMICNLDNSNSIYNIYIDAYRIRTQVDLYIIGKAISL